MAFLAGGVPAILVFPWPSLSSLAWFALVPGMVLFTRAATTREAAARGWWFGAAYLIAMLYWMAPQIGPGLLLIGGGFGCLWAPVAGAGSRLLQAPGFLAPGPRRADRGAERLAGPRVDQVVPGPRGTVGAVRRVPVAAPRRPRARQRRGSLAGQRRPAARERRAHAAARRRPPGPASFRSPG